MYEQRDIFSLCTVHARLARCCGDIHNLPGYLGYTEGIEMVGAIKLGSILGVTLGVTFGLMHSVPAGAPVVHLAPQLSPRVQVAVQVATPSPAPTNAKISYIRPVSAKKSPKAPKATPEISSTPTPTPSPIIYSGMWTPYNGHCEADCYPDLTPEAMTAVNEYFKGSLEAPGPNGPEFKGLTGTRLDHYICEYAHVLGDQWAMDGCKGVD